jgi:hypothetical protein
MPSPVRVNHTGRELGPFIVTGPARRKRTWRMRCAQGHVSERRIDTMLRVKEESLRCVECWRSRKRIADDDDAGLLAQR